MTAIPPAASASPPRSSTTRFTMPSASGRSPPCTHRSNQYHVVMEVAPEYGLNPEGLRNIYVTSSGGQQVPLSALAHYAPTTAPLAVNHQGPFSAVTLSFNLQPGVALGDAVDAINAAEKKIGFPETVAAVFKDGAGLSGFAGQRTLPDRNGPYGRLYRPRHFI